MWFYASPHPFCPLADNNVVLDLPFSHIFPKKALFSQSADNSPPPHQAGQPNPTTTLEKVGIVLQVDNTSAGHFDWGLQEANTGTVAIASCTASHH